MIDAQSVIPPALVYVRTNGRLAPQVWHAPVTDLTGYWQGRIAWSLPLAREFAALPLDTLAKIFPPPATEESR